MTSHCVQYAWALTQATSLKLGPPTSTVRPKSITSTQHVTRGRPVVVFVDALPWIPVYGRYYIFCGRGSDQTTTMSEVPYLVARKAPPYAASDYRDESMWLQVGMVLASEDIVQNAHVHQYEDFTLDTSPRICSTAWRTGNWSRGPFSCSSQYG